MNYTAEELKEIIRPVAEKYDIIRISLFGSRACGDSTSESDYDFCILPRYDVSLTELSNLRIDLKELLNSEVDLICEDSIDGKFTECIAGEMILLCEKKTQSHQ